MSLPEVSDQQLQDLADFYAGEGGWQSPTTGDLLDQGLIDYEESVDGSAMWVTPLGEKVLEANHARLSR